MRLSRRLLAATAAAVVLPALTSCADHEIGNTNNHITKGPALPSVEGASSPAPSESSPESSPETHAPAAH